MPTITTTPVSAGTTSATAANTLFSSLIFTVNNENVRSEGIDTRNLSGSNLIYQQYTYNGTELAIGSELGTVYGSVAGGGDQEQALDVQVKPALTLATGDLVRLDWTVTLWSIDPQDDLHDLPDTYIDTVAGSGYGEWCFLIYPKVDITDSTCTNYVTLSSIAEVTVPSIGTLAAGPGKGFRCDSTAHFSVVPMHYLGKQVDDPVLAYYARGDQTGGKFMRPRVIRGSYWLVVPEASNGDVLHGVNLFTSGVWRLEVISNRLCFFLEDKASANAGVSDGIILERATLGVAVYRGV